MAKITPAQIRAARALLNWSRKDLSKRSGVSMRALANIEHAEAKARDRTLIAIGQALSMAGVEFIDTNGTAGIGLRPHWRNR